MKRFTLLLLLIAAASALALPPYSANSRAQSPTEPRRLFDPVGAEKPVVAAASGDRAAAQTAAVREQEIRVNFAAADDFAGARELGLPLFGRSYTAVRSELEGFVASPGGGLVWRGKIHGPGGWSGDVTLSAKGRALSGLIYSPEAVYEIIPQKEFGHLLVQLDQSLFPPCGGALPPDAAPETASTDAAATSAWAKSTGAVVSPAAADDGSRIDVLVVYTAAMRTALGGTTQAEAFAQEAVSTTNTAYINSDIHTRLRLAGTLEVNYSETNDLPAALSWAVSEATVNAARNSARADLVAFIVETVSGDCGVGRLMSRSTLGPGFSVSSYSVTSRRCAVGNLTFAHELGHNQGCQHNPENGGSPDVLAYPYAFGHYVDHIFRTVMSYSDPCTSPNFCPRVAHFSNPSVNYNGVPTGIADQRDNSRVINNTAAIVAQFRESVVGDPPPNDNFANASALGGAAGIFMGTNNGATKEPGEPDYGHFRTGGVSVWFTWQAPANGSTTVSTVGSTFNTVLTVYTGSGLGGLTFVGQNHLINPAAGTSSVTFNATAGTNYRISVDGNSGATGRLRLNWSQNSACAYSISPASQSFPAEGGAGNVSVTALAGCGWTAASDGGFFQITGGNSGTGDGTVGYAVAVNPGAGQRTGTLTIAGQTFTVTQDGTTLPASTFQFSQSTYSTFEGSDSATVTVTRSGSLTAAATVEYATTDGSATDRGDYNTTIGRLRFAAGEGSKTFSVLVTDDVYAEGTESLNLTLSNPTGGAALDPPSIASLSITDNDAVNSGSNPIDATPFFVRQQYVDFFSREPDAPGLAFWSGGIESCGADAGCREVKRVDTSAAFFLSIEFQQTGFLVHRLYRAAFNRLARYREFVRDTQEIGRGVVVNSPGWEAQLEANKAAFLSEFTARADFQALYNPMTNAQYVDALNANAAGSLSQGERDSLVAGLDAATETRATVLRKIADDADLRARETSPAFVLMQYFGYLRRNPDDAPNADFSGYEFWLGKLNDFGGDYIRSEMVKAFLDSVEYRRRFGQ